MKEAFEELQKKLFTGKSRDCYLAGKLSFAEEFYSYIIMTKYDVNNEIEELKNTKIGKFFLQIIQDEINQIANEVYNDVKPSINFTGAKEK